MEASCNCGAVTVRVLDSDLFTKRRGHICHCYNCKRTSGSTCGANLIIEKEKVQMTGEGNLTTYVDKDSKSGRPVNRFFCKTCGKYVCPFPCAELLFGEMSRGGSSTRLHT